MCLLFSNKLDHPSTSVMNIIRPRFAPIYHYSPQSVNSYIHTHIDQRSTSIQNGCNHPNCASSHSQHIPRGRRCSPTTSNPPCVCACCHLHTCTVFGMVIGGRNTVYRNIIPVHLVCECVGGADWEGDLEMNRNCSEELLRPQR